MNIITWSIVGTKLVIAITFFQQYMKKISFSENIFLI